jgi:lipoic acid synthetase
VIPSDASAVGRKPSWLKVKAPEPRQYRATGAVVDELDLHTVCREARCPNRGECYSAGTATFLILGRTCTRACRFCSVEHAVRRDAVDADEPRRVAEAARRLRLRHVVITSVTRDDLPDGGAGHFAAAVVAVRAGLPAATVEVLIPDLGGDEAALAKVLAARPDVLGHNLETVPRLYTEVRPQADYSRSMELLRRAAAWAAALGLSRTLVKTGLMVGLGERPDEVESVLRDCAAAGVGALTVGQYLQPDAGCLPVARYVPPEEFRICERHGAALGMSVVAAPFARSSYRAGSLLDRQRAEWRLSRSTAPQIEGPA